MTVDTLAFLFGAVLLVAALLGGGLEAKEIKIPKLRGRLRVLSFLLGVSFILLGLWLNRSSSQPTISLQDGASHRPSLSSDAQLQTAPPTRDSSTPEQVASRTHSLGEVTVGQTVFTVLGARLEDYSDDSKLLRLEVRATFNSEALGGMLFSGDNLRLVIDGVPRAPEDGPSQLVDPWSEKEAMYTFLVPSDATSLKLRVHVSGVPPRELLLDMESIH